MLEALVGSIIAIFCVLLGFRLGRLTLDKSEPIFPETKEMRKRILQPFSRKDKRTPIVRDDQAAWAKEFEN